MQALVRRALDYKRGQDYLRAGSPRSVRRRRRHRAQTVRGKWHNVPETFLRRHQCPCPNRLLPRMEARWWSLRCCRASYHRRHAAARISGLPKRSKCSLSSPCCFDQNNGPPASVRPYEGWRPLFALQFGLAEVRQWSESCEGCTAGGHKR